MLKRHTHKLRRHVYKTGSAVYFCIDDCNFKVATHLALGKKTICHRCGDEFKMNEYHIRLARPHCDKCHKRKDKKNASTNATPISSSNIGIRDPFDVPNPLTGLLGPEGFAEEKAEGIEVVSSLSDRLKRVLNEFPEVSEVDDNDEGEI